MINKITRDIEEINRTSERLLDKLDRISKIAIKLREHIAVIDIRVQALEDKEIRKVDDKNES